MQQPIYNKLYALVATKYDWNKLEPAYEQIYVDLYTEQELDGILAFYKSPIGQALLSKRLRLPARCWKYPNNKCNY
jgi:hypothetical protein